jgi:succinate dehydrogenase / fumarate reductase cytochrome b subunit
MTTPLHEKEFPSDERVKLPRPFILRRLHSLLGLWLVVYLFEHLLVNSQAALFLEDDGSGFVRMVNSIHTLPYLKAIEILFLGVPFLIHGIWGIKYALTSKSNSFRTGGTKPALPQYKRNSAFTWQRITSWLLLVGIVAHVVHMRFMEYPVKTQRGDQTLYLSRLNYDPGLSLVAEKLYVKLYNTAQIREKELELEKEKALLETLKPETQEYEPNDLYYKALNEVQEDEEWMQAARKKPLRKGQVLAAAPSAGAAFFLIVRQAFMSPTLVVLYSILVVAAVYHAFNGVWTFMITWGITLSRRSQKTMRTITTTLMAAVMLLGLMSAWGTYWTNLFLR